MRKNRKGLLFEALMILILSLVLSFIYNTVSPAGIELLPERVLKKKAEKTVGINTSKPLERRICVYTASKC